jgi:hypothetical protein
MNHNARIIGTERKLWTRTASASHQSASTERQVSRSVRSPSEGGFKTKKAALNAEAKKRDEVARGTYVKPSHEILAELDRLVGAVR